MKYKLFIALMSFSFLSYAESREVNEDLKKRAASAQASLESGEREIRAIEKEQEVWEYSRKFMEIDKLIDDFCFQYKKGPSKDKLNGLVTSYFKGGEARRKKYNEFLEKASKFVKVNVEKIKEKEKVVPEKIIVKSANIKYVKDEFKCLGQLEVEVPNDKLSFTIDIPINEKKLLKKIKLRK